MRRKFVSIVIALSFVVIMGTSVLMYLRPYASSTASLHTAFGFIFLTIGLLHITNNLRPLKNYIVDKKQTLSLSWQFVSSVVLAACLAYLFYTGSLGFGAIYDWGSDYRNSQAGRDSRSQKVDYISLEQSIGQYQVSLEGKLGNAFKYPMFAAWLEDADGNYLHTIYVSESIGTSTFDYKKGKKGRHIIRRPSGLPVWAHKRNIAATDGLMIPLGKEPDLDGYTGATPLEDFVIESQLKPNKDSIVHIYFEVNQSYDWNEYYSKDRFPQDSIYTISGQSGQPSVVYKATIDLRELSNENSKIMSPVGHSHHSGADGSLYPDLSKVTTAFDIVSRIIVTVDKY